MHFYQSHIQIHIWAYVYSSLNLSFVVFRLSQFLSNATSKHMTNVKRVYPYLQATKNLKILYCVGFTEYFYLEVNTDANWANNKKRQKSTLKYITFLLGYLVSSSLKKQTIITQCSTKTEYIAILETTKEVVSIRRLLENLCQLKIYLILLHFDRQGLIALAKNSENYQQTKHRDVWYYYI